MFKRFSDSWQLAKSSWTVLQTDKQLFIFPVISMIGLILVSITFLFPFAFTNLLDHMDAGNSQNKMIGFLILFFYYIVSYTIIFYCNTALVGAALIRIRGGTPTMRDGFNIANEHFFEIIEYAVIASTVGLLLQWLRDRGILGRMAAGLFGFAWSIATFLVVPVLVTEKVSPINAIKRSSALLKKTWGEQLIGNAGIGMIFSLMIVATIFAGAGLYIFTATASPVLAAMIVVTTLLAVILLLLVSSALSSIYVAAVYEFATESKVINYFTKEQITGAFKQK